MRVCRTHIVVHTANEEMAKPVKEVNKNSETLRGNLGILVNLLSNCSRGTGDDLWFSQPRANGSQFANINVYNITLIFWRRFEHKTRVAFITAVYKDNFRTFRNLFA